MNQIVIKTSFLEKTIPIVLVELGGYINQSTSEKVQKVFDNLFIAGHYSTIFDFSKVVYMSSAGWGIFVGEVKRFRENSGDIKIVNMNAEVYEIFQILEFFHILSDYNTIEEALEAYGIQIAENGEEEEKPAIAEKTPSPKPEGVPAADTTLVEKELQLSEQHSVVPQETPVKIAPKERIIPLKIKKPGDDHPEEQTLELDISQLPVQEKIRMLVAQFPLLSIRRMQQMLRHEDFGHERIGLIKLYRLLREMDLEKKTKRYRYYRSC